MLETQTLLQELLRVVADFKAIGMQQLATKGRFYL